MAKITSIPIYKNVSLSAGTSLTSDIVDLRYCANKGFFSLSHRIAAGTSSTVGTTVFTYTMSPTEGGTFFAPASSIAIGTAGSHGTYGTANVWTFEPEMMPFMKIVSTQTGSGGTGANTKIVGLELHIQ